MLNLKNIKGGKILNVKRKERVKNLKCVKLFKILKFFNRDQVKWWVVKI